MGDEGTPTLAADDRMAHMLSVASELDGPNHSRSVLIQAIADGHIRAARMGSIIVDAEATANVNHAHTSAEPGELTVDLSCLGDAISK
ncbi:hypothetical protein T12_11147 [Trichinella patagoniensis]|uniref:Uncharacterized protein n=1 Tax=Trichinella patagoniensis TaxID=990121 RepID=A0A0V0YUY4_9BILA|nr:hypothetical protein T12_11147 [Trichinella patagoniensis]